MMVYIISVLPKMKGGAIMRFIKNTLLVLMSFAAAIIGAKFLNGISTDTLSQHKMQTLFYAYLIVFVVMWAYAFFTGLISLGLSIKSKRKVHYISSLITKILMIPFFVVNLLMWIQVLGFFGKISVALLLFGGILILGIPTIILGCLAVAGTYVIMISTSVNLIVPFIKKIFKKEASPVGVIGTIFLFIFCLDAIGAGLLGLCTRNNNSNSEQLRYQA